MPYQTAKDMIGTSSITALISAFRTEVAQNSISPEKVGGILHQIVDALSKAASNGDVADFLALQERLQALTTIYTSLTQGTADRNHIYLTPTTYNVGSDEHYTNADSIRIQQANDEMEEAKLNRDEYEPFRFPNGDTRKELLIRSRYLLFKSADKWTNRQKERATILFEEYPDLKKAYGLCHSLRMIFSKNLIKDAARLSMARWYNQVEEAGFKSFNTIAATFYEHYDEILNFYENRSSNAMAECFNAKIKLFRANLRGVVDKKFFLFRISNLYAYPQ